MGLQDYKPDIPFNERINQSIADYSSDEIVL